ncbi:unnamed protein product [Urochloa decumbens]|uniref:F-box domain-containing protein n=1 Tax=Urochloa decumbens TaxID=240449 RepID=A0ABC8Z9K6_9POAL
MEEANNGRDFPSQLPSDALLCILDKLDLRDAVRAGALSRRWRCLQLPRLSLRMEDFLPANVSQHRYYDDEADGDQQQVRRPGRHRDALSDASDAMLRAATALLSSRGGGAGCTVAMSFLLRHNYMSLGRLLDAAVAAGKVRAVDLEVSTTSDLYLTDDARQTREAMAAHGRRFRTELFDGCPAAFGAALTRLALKNMYLSTPGDLADILGACANLETLSLYASGVRAAPKRPRPWSVRHPRLADISLTYCAFAGVELAWLPRLERLAYKECGSLAADDKKKPPPLSFGHVWVQPEASKRFADIFRNLQHLRIRNVHEECGLPWTMFLLQAAPNLKELCIKLWDHECDFELDESSTSSHLAAKKKSIVWEEVPAGFKHYNLARVTILGFYNTRTGSQGIARFLRSLVQAAVNLEEIHVREKAPCDECEVMEIAGSPFPRTDEDKDTFRESICGGGSTPLKICIVHHQQGLNISLPS